MMSLKCLVIVVKLCIIISFVKVIDTEANELINIKLVENWGRCMVYPHVTGIHHPIASGLVQIGKQYKDLKVVSSFFDV